VSANFISYIRLNELHKSTGQLLRQVGSFMEKRMIFQLHCKPNQAEKDSQLRHVKKISYKLTVEGSRNNVVGM
jgi:hypothetical protein